MRRDLLNLFTTWEVVSFIILAFVIIALVFYFIAHKFFRSYLINAATHNTAGVFNILSISTVLLAFTIVILWQFYIKTIETVAQETTALEEIIMYSQALSQTANDEVDSIIGNYLYLVVNKEWPAMRQGDLSPETNKAIKQLYYFLAKYSPTSENERLFYNKIIDKYENVLTARDIRMNAVDSVIPGYFFTIIIINLIFMVFTVCLLDEKGSKAPLLISLLVAIIAGVNLGLTVTLDFPFSGEFSVSSEPYTQDLLGQLYRQHIPSTTP